MTPDSILAEEPKKIEVTGAEQEAKTRLHRCGTLESSEKKWYFFGRRGGFSVDSPFNGCPHALSLPISGYQILHSWHHSTSCPEKSELYIITGVLISSDRTQQTAQTIDLLIAQKNIIRIFDHKRDRFCQRIYAFVI